jgi:hypothetical protein
MKREFLKTPYMGADDENFRKEFVEYLKHIIANNRWEAMSEHTLYLQGAKKAIEEIISEIEEV